MCLALQNLEGAQRGRLEFASDHDGARPQRWSSNDEQVHLRAPVLGIAQVSMHHVFPTDRSDCGTTTGRCDARGNDWPATEVILDLGLQRRPQAHQALSAPSAAAGT